MIVIEIVQLLDNISKKSKTNIELKTKVNRQTNHYIEKTLVCTPISYNLAYNRGSLILIINSKTLSSVITPVIEL